MPIALVAAAAAALVMFTMWCIFKLSDDKS